MVMSKKIFEDISTDINLFDFLEKEKAIFKEEQFKKISEEDKIAFVKDNSLAQKQIDETEELYREFGVFLLVFCGFPVTIFSLFDNFYFLPLSLILVISGVIFINKSTLKSLHNNLIKDWIEENENVLKEKIFYNTVADKDILKNFVNIYGRQELVNLLMGKESLTYNDISFYIENIKIREEQKNKEIRLSEAVTCLIEETA